MADRRVQFATDHRVGGVSYKKGQCVEMEAGAAASLTFSGVVRPAPTPADVAGDNDTATGLGLPRPDTTSVGEQPRIINEPVAPPPPAPPPPTAPAAAPAIADSTTPTPISRPAPRYPREALARGVGGTVQVRAVIATDGSVERMEVAESSGNRYLDRAAMEAVRRWKFKPAVRGGQAVAAEVIVPLEFNPGR